MGPNPSNRWKLPGRWACSRARLLLRGSCASHVGGHVVLCPPWNVFDGRDWFEEGLGNRHVADAEGGVGSVDRWVCDGDRRLAVLPADDSVQL